MSSAAGKIVVITGCGRGIGAHLTQRFLQSGFRVAACDITQNPAADLAAHFNKPDQKPLLFAAQCDVTTEESVAAFVQGAAAAFSDSKRWHCLINNAAIANPFMPAATSDGAADSGAKPTLADLNIDALRQFLNVNVVGQAIVMKHCAKFLLSDGSDVASRNGGSGSIINISSTRAGMSEANSEGYASSKGALESLTHAVAATNSGTVRCNAIRLGWVHSTGPEDAALSAEDHAFHFSGRVGRAEDVFQMCCFLADSEKSGFVNGAVMTLDGGVTRKMIYPQ